MKDPKEEIARKLARAIADDAEVDWSSLGLDPSTLPRELDNLRRLSQVANSFERHLRTTENEASGAPLAARKLNRGGSKSAQARSEPSRWGSLEIQSQLGEGTFGTVYLAFDPLLEREVALKLWKTEPRAAGTGRASKLERDRWTRRLLEEGRRMARIRHPNVVTVYGADVHEGRVGIWTERLLGETLSDRLARDGLLPATEAARIGSSIAEALNAAHGAGVLHGDVKESNVAVEDDGRVVLFDFGSGRLLADPTALEPLSGTPFYVAPEVLLDGEEPGVLSDLYALGVLLHRLTTGRYPIEAESLEDLLARHREHRQAIAAGLGSERPATEPDSEGAIHSERSTLDPDSSMARGFRELIMRAIDPNPASRFESAAQAARELRFLLESALGEGVPVQLPESITRFFGRESELERVRAKLAAHRLVTLTGAGGCGKSRLALEAARPLALDFPEGTFWVELAAISSEEGVIPAILHTMGMVGRTPADLPALVQRLKSRQVLLVFDNAEHLAEAVRQVAERIVSETAGIKILVTSRRALGGTVEVLFRVPPLPVPPEVEDPLHDWESPDAPDRKRLEDSAASEIASVGLFADRAGRRDSEFDLARSRPAVERICRLLDGLPLALEIAAARAAALGVEEIAQQLARSLNLGEDAGADARQRSPRLSVDWSYRLLPPEAQVALRRLAVFAGGWSTASAVAVVDQPDFSVLESLAVLVEHSLIERRNAGAGAGAGRVRFFMLKTIREFAEELLASAGEMDAARNRHARHYRELYLRGVPQLQTREHAAALELLDEENANLESILAHGLIRGAQEDPAAEDHAELVTSLTGYWHLSGRDNVAVQHLTKCLDALDPRLSPRSRGRLYLARGRFVYLLGFRAAEGDLLDAENLLAGSHDQEYARVLTALGSVAAALLRFDEAESRLHAAVDLAERLGDDDLLCRALTRIADLRFKQSRMEEAERAVRSAEELAQPQGDPGQLSVLLLIRGAIAWDRGQLEESLRVHEACLDATAGTPLVASRSICYTNLGNIRWAMGQQDLAQRYWHHAERLERRWGQDVRRATLLLTITSHLPPEQRALIQIEAFDTLIRFDHLRHASQALSEIGATCVALGETELGVRILGAAEEYRRSRQIALPAPSQKHLEAYAETARSGLPAGRFEEVWEAGRQSSIEEMRALAGQNLETLAIRPANPPSGALAADNPPVDDEMT